ncbi:MAG: hypothetical protein QW692_00625 [Nitrososphaerota archaeon]
MNAGGRNPDLSPEKGGARGLDPLSPAQGVNGPESAGQQIEKIKQIVQECLRKVDELEKARDIELSQLTIEDLERLADLEIHEKYSEAIEKLYDECEKELSAFFDEMDLEWLDDYTLRLGKKRVGDKVYTYYYHLPEQEIGVAEFPVINENETPFTYALLHNIDWAYIRSTWSVNIANFIAELAEAERRGNLEKVLEEVEKKLEAGGWIYDYQHFYRALEKTKQMVMENE